MPAAERDNLQKMMQQLMQPQATAKPANASCMEWQDCNCM
jgi:hypothetical protein